MALNSLYQLLSQHFDKSELRELCFDLHIDYEELLEQRKGDFVRELILYCQRHERLPDLLAACRQIRPNVTWPDNVENIELGLVPIAFWRRPLVIGSLIFIGILALITTILVNLGARGLIDVLATETPTATATATATLVPTATSLPTATPFPVEQPGEVLIVIATFHRPEEVINTEPHIKIRRAIENAAAELDFANLRVVVDPTSFSADQREEAETLGKLYDASMIIWGEDTAIEVIVNFLNLKSPDYYAAEAKVEEQESTQLRNPDAYAQFLTQNIPSQMTFLSLFAMGQSYYLEERYDEAIQLIEVAILGLEDIENLPEGVSDAYFRLGWLYQVIKDDSNIAVEMYTNALNINSENASAYNNRGFARYNLGDLEGALADYNLAIKFDPGFAHSYLNRSIIHREMDNKRDALSDYRRYLEYFPNAVYRKAIREHKH